MSPTMLLPIPWFDSHTSIVQIDDTIVSFPDQRDCDNYYYYYYYDSYYDDDLDTARNVVVVVSWVNDEDMAMIWNDQHQ